MLNLWQLFNTNIKYRSMNFWIKFLFRKLHKFKKKLFIKQLNKNIKQRLMI